MSLLSRAADLLGVRQKNYVQTLEGMISQQWPSNWWQLGYSAQTNAINGVAETAIQANAQGTAVCPVQHRLHKSSGERRLVADSPFVTLLENPNTYQTRSDLMLNTVRSLLYTGNAYWYLSDGSQEYAGVEVPDSIHLLNPNTTRAFWADETGDVFFATNLHQWLHDEVLDPFTLPARRVAHFKLHTHLDPLRGISPLQAAVSSIAANNAILRHQAAFYTNSARPSGVLSTDDKLTKDQMLQLREAFEIQSQGLNAGKIPVLGNGMKWLPMTLSSQDSQMVEAYKMTVEDISRVFRVPLPLVNSMQGATFTNSETLINFWLATGLGFLLQHVELVMNKAFKLPVTDRLAFDTSVLLRSDMKARLEALGLAVIGGIYSPNEARALEGLPPAKDGEEPRVQQQVVPLTWHAEQAKIAEIEAKKPPPALPPPSAEEQTKPTPAPAPAKKDRQTADLLTHLKGVTRRAA